MQILPRYWAGVKHSLKKMPQFGEEIYLTLNKNLYLI